MSHLTPNQVSRFLPHLHPGPDIHTHQSESQDMLTSIQVASFLHPGNENFSSAPSRTYLTATNIFKFNVFIWHFLHNYSLRASSFIHVSHLLTCLILPLSRSLDSRLSSIQVTCHLHPRPDFHVSAPSRSRLTSIHITKIPSQLHWSHDLCQSKPHDMRLTPPRFHDMYLISIQFPRRTHPGLEICASPSSRSRLTSIQIPWIASQLHACHISSQFRSQGKRYCHCFESTCRLNALLCRLWEVLYLIIGSLWSIYPSGYPPQIPGEYTAAQIGRHGLQIFPYMYPFAPRSRKTMQCEVPCSWA